MIKIRVVNLVKARPKLNVMRVRRSPRVSLYSSYLFNEGLPPSLQSWQIFESKTSATSLILEDLPINMVHFQWDRLGQRTSQEFACFF